MSHRLLDKAELLSLLKISDPTLQRYLRAGVIPEPVFLGEHSRSPRWIESEVMAVIEARMQARQAAEGRSTGAAGAAS